MDCLWLANYVLLQVVYTVKQIKFELTVQFSVHVVCQHELKESYIRSTSWVFSPVCQKQLSPAVLWTKKSTLEWWCPLWLFRKLSADFAGAASRQDVNKMESAKMLNIAASLGRVNPERHYAAVNITVSLISGNPAGLYSDHIRLQRTW